MDSLIADLQKDIFENKDVKSILNKALVISNELELKEFNEWINVIPVVFIVFTLSFAHTAQTVCNFLCDIV